MKSAVLVLLVCTLVSSSLGQDSRERVSTGQSQFLNATLSLWNWLLNMDHNLDAFVAREDRRQLADRLHKLNEKLEDVESAKLNLIFDIKHSQGTDLEVKRTNDLVAALVEKIAQLQDSVHDVTIILREHQGGADVEQQLGSATRERKEWVFELANNPELLRSLGSRERIAYKGELAVENLRRASLELANLTAKLNSQ